MASEIIDVVHKLSYQVDASPLGQAINQINSHTNKISQLQAKINTLQKSLTENPGSEARQAAVKKQIDSITASLKAEQAAMAKTVSENKALQQAIQREMGLLGQLQNRINSLTQARARSFNVSEIKKYTAEIKSLQGQINKLTGGGTGSGISNAILNGIGFGGGLAVVTTAISALKGFASESAEAYEQLQGVQIAFDRLNQPNLLGNLREATKGTVSDLELMKRAVQFNNFGLPIERLATAFSFARQRARETGEDVNYLVQSIVTGIGRQSPLILDNLGINAKRVRDEFQRVGDFAQAAFNIIEEEGKKGGSQIETLADQTARLDTQYKNLQASLGGFFSRQGLIIKSIIADTFTGSDNLNELARLEANQERIAAETKVQKEILSGLQQFAIEYAKVDQKGRIEVLKLAENYFDQLLADAEKFYGEDIDGFIKYQKNFLAAQDTFYKQINDLREKNKPPKSLNEQNVADLEQTIKRNKELIDAFSLADLKDNANLSTRNKLLKEITDAQAKIDAIQGNKKKDKKDPYQLALDQIKDQRNIAEETDSELKELRAAQLRYAADYANLLKTQRESEQKITESEIQKQEEDYRRNNDRILQLIELRQIAIRRLSLRSEISTANRFGKPGDAARATKELKQLDLTEQDVLIRLRANVEIIPARVSVLGRTDLKLTDRDKPIRIEEGLAGDESVDAVISRLDRIQAKIEENEQKAIQSYENITSAALQAANLIYNAQISALDREISYRETRLDYAQKLAERGNTEVLQNELDAIAKAQQARELAAQRQLQLNSIIQASNSAVALTEAIGAIIKAAATGDPYTIALRVTAAVGALVTGIAALYGAFGNASRGFKEGGYTGDGQENEPAGIVHKGEVVWSQKDIQKAGGVEMVEKMRKGIAMPIYPMQKGLTIDNHFASKGELKNISNKLDEVVEAIEDNRLKQDIRLDRNGLGIYTERAIREARRRWK